MKNKERLWHWNGFNHAFWFFHRFFFEKLGICFEDLEKYPLKLLDEFANDNHRVPPPEANDPKPPPDAAATAPNPPVFWPTWNKIQLLFSS